MDKEFEATMTINVRGKWKDPPADEEAQRKRESFSIWLRGQLNIYFPELQGMINEIRERAGDYPDGL